MFIHEMTVDECSGALKEMRLGRLACAQDNQPYIVPINFAFDAGASSHNSKLGCSTPDSRAR